MFVSAEKAAKNGTVVRRQNDIEVLRNEITTSSTFQSTRSTEKEIIHKT